MSGITAPDELWFYDLRELIKEKMNGKHEIIVAGDFNDDLKNIHGVMRTFMRNIGLKEIMMAYHDGKGPATHIRGSTTINGAVFASDRIAMTMGNSRIRKLDMWM
jgi:hypothetical protein